MLICGKRCLDDRLVFGKTKPNPLMISTVLKEEISEDEAEGGVGLEYALGTGWSAKGNGRAERRIF
jgi:hypothetical protein